MSDDQSPGTYPTGALPSNTQLQQRYLIQRRLGQGGMGSVYLGHDSRLDIECAIKEMSTSLLKDDEERERAIKSFHEEAKLLARLSHPNLPRVTDHFSENGKEYLVMEYVPGETLANVMREKPLPWEMADVLAIAQPLTEVLHYLHTRKPSIIFRDLKPANVIRTPEGEIKLIDFGIARLFKPGQSHDTQAFGTMGYSAPEQYGQGQTDARADVYSLAILLHQLATGFDPVAKPFGIPQAYQLNPNVPQGLSNAIQHGMSHDPEDRFGSMQAFWRALKSQADAKPVPPPTFVAGPTQAVSPPAPAYGVLPQAQPGFGPPRPPSGPIAPQGPLRPPSGPMAQPGYAPQGPPRPPSGPMMQPGYGPPPSGPMAQPGYAPQGPPRPPSGPMMQPGYGPPPSGPMAQPGYGPPVNQIGYGPAQPPSGPMPGYPPAGGMPPVMAQPFAASRPLPQRQSNSVATASRNLGFGGIGLAILGLFLGASRDAAMGLGLIAILLGFVAFVLSLIGLAKEQAAASPKGRQHSTLGLSLGLVTFVLACLAIGFANS